MTFISFIFRIPRNRRYLFTVVIGAMVQFIIFKILYPFPDFFSDSYSYIYAAQANLNVSIWPIGYSKFLRLFHFITYSDTALIAFQYFLYELSALYFFFSILYFYQPVKSNEIILLIFLFFNPLFLYVCNYVNSDPLFLALSMFWFTELLWILNRPKLYQIWIQAILLFVCFTVRNNAYYYPIVAALVFTLSRQILWRKVMGALLGIVLIIPFIIHTRNESFKITGTRQFSLFTGWQLANNSLYMYEYVDTAKVLSPKGKELDKLVKSFFLKTPSKFLHDSLLTDQGNFFIRAPYSPLKRYMHRHYKITDEYSSVIAWGKASPIFEEYGSYLIKHNLGAYLWEFMLPNMKNYFIPYLEKLEVYNLGEDKVSSIAQHWFHYKSDRITSFSKRGQGSILNTFPAIFFAINLYLLGNTLWFVFKRKYEVTSSYFNRSLLLVIFYHVVNFIFCVSTTIIVFRYQIFPMIICFSFGLILTEWLDKKKLKNNISRIDVGDMKLATQKKESIFNL